MTFGNKSSTKATIINKHDESSLALVHVDVDIDQPQPLSVAPIVSSYNEKIRPVLDALENLRRLNIAKEGIQLLLLEINLLASQVSLNLLLVSACLEV